MAHKYAKRLTAFKTADAINAIEGVPVSTYARELSTRWSKGEISGEEMKKSLLESHRRIAEELKENSTGNKLLRNT